MGALWSEETAAGGAGCKSDGVKRVGTAGVLQRLDEALLSRLVLHRGYHDRRDVVTKRPLENTLKAFTLGWKMGVRHCECDITVTKDGKVILAHDETLERVAIDSPLSQQNPISTIALSDLTYEEISQVRLKDGSSVPLLEEVLTCAISCHGLLVVELKSTDDWPRLVEKTAALFSTKPHLLAGVSVFMSFNHLLMQRLKTQLEKLNFALPPCLGLTDTDLWPGYEDIIWSIEEDNSLDVATKFVEDFNLDGLYVKYEKGFEDKINQPKLHQLLDKFTMGIWNAPDAIADLKFWSDFGFQFVNTDLTTHFTRTSSFNQLNNAHI